MAENLDIKRVDASVGEGNGGMPFISDANINGVYWMEPTLKHMLDTSYRPDKRVVKRMSDKMEIKFNDADIIGSVFFPRQLEFIHANTYDVLYTDIVFRGLFPILDLQNAGYTSHTYRVFDKVGKAKYLGSDVNDMPMVNLGGREVTQKVEALGVGYGANMRELAAGGLVQLDVLQKNANAARRAHEELLNEGAFFGNAEFNIPGLLTNANIDKADVPNGGGGNPEWPTKTPEEIIKDINQIISDVAINSKQKHIANTLIMPDVSYEFIRKTARTNTSDKTILAFVQENNPGVNIVPVVWLRDAGTAGVNVMIAYQKDPEVGQVVIGLEQTFLDPQLRGFRIDVPSWGTNAGFSVQRPLGFVIREKI